MIENHVVSLELSKRLKELGVKQESCFYWFTKIESQITKIVGDEIYGEGEIKSWVEEDMDVSALAGVDKYPAYIASELGEMLPMTQPDESGDYICDGYFSVSMDEKEGKRIWSSQYDGSGFFEGGSIADAIAKMLIHLIEQGIIKV